MDRGPANSARRAAPGTGRRLGSADRSPRSDPEWVRGSPSSRAPRAVTAVQPVTGSHRRGVFRKADRYRPTPATRCTGSDIDSPGTAPRDPSQVRRIAEPPRIFLPLASGRLDIGRASRGDGSRRGGVLTRRSGGAGGAFAGFRFRAPGVRRGPRRRATTGSRRSGPAKAAPLRRRGSRPGRAPECSAREPGRAAGPEMLESRFDTRPRWPVDREPTGAIVLVGEPVGRRRRPTEADLRELKRTSPRTGSARWSPDRWRAGCDGRRRSATLRAGRAVGRTDRVTRWTNGRGPSCRKPRTDSAGGLGDVGGDGSRLRRPLADAASGGRKRPTARSLRSGIPRCPCRRQRL